MPPNDIPSAVLKKFAEELSYPITHIVNASLFNKQWPTLFKKEFVTPVPKEFPVKEMKQLRSISGLLSLNKIQEKIVGQLIMSDIKDNIDVSQYGNQPGLSIQHYLVNMILALLVRPYI